MSNPVSHLQISPTHNPVGVVNMARCGFQFDRLVDLAEPLNKIGKRRPLDKGPRHAYANRISVSITGGIPTGKLNDLLLPSGARRIPPLNLSQ
jgi:hypothetical protein